MKNARHYLLISLLSTLFFVGQFGCAHIPQNKPDLASDKVSVELGTIGVVSAQFQPEFKYFQKPMSKGKAAGVGAVLVATETAVGGVYVGAMSGHPLGLAIGTAAGLVLTPVGAAVGAVWGAVEGEPSKKIKEAEEILNHIPTEAKAQEAMLGYILSSARERTGTILVSVEGHGPAALDEEVDYSFLKKSGIDTVLEVSVRKSGLWAEKNKNIFNPPLSFFMTMSIKLIRVADQTELYNRTFRYEEGETRKFTDWAMNNAQPFKEEFDRSCVALSEWIVKDLFLPMEQSLVHENHPEKEPTEW